MRHETVGLRGLLVTEAHHFPHLAERFYWDGPLAYIAALDRHLGEPEQAEALFALLLREPHRQHLLGLRAAPDTATAPSNAEAALARLDLVDCSTGWIRSRGALPGSVYCGYGAEPLRCLNRELWTCRL